MTTDTTPLQERIARALDPWIWTDEDDDPSTFRRLVRRNSRLAERPASMERAAAVLPIIARLEAQSDIRGRAVVIYRDRARQAEAERDEWRQTALDERAAALDALEQIKARDARIKAVQDVLSYADMGETLVTRSRIRRALDGDS